MSVFRLKSFSWNTEIPKSQLFWCLLQSEKISCPLEVPFLNHKIANFAKIIMFALTPIYNEVTLNLLLQTILRSFSNHDIKTEQSERPARLISWLNRCVPTSVNSVMEFLFWWLKIELQYFQGYYNTGWFNPEMRSRAVFWIF